MQDEKKKPLKWLEIVLLIILTPLIYIGGITLLYKPVMYKNIGDWFLSPWTFFAILGLNIIWFVVMVKQSSYSIRVRIVSTWLILTSSASILTCWIVIKSLSGIW